MRLTKKINNNVALGVDGAGRDLVVFGKGVGFPHMPYELVDTSKVQRIFYNVSAAVAAVAANLDDNVLLASSDIVELAKMELGCSLNPNLAFTLADHIQFAMERGKKGLHIENPLSGDVALVYPVELELGRKACQMVAHRCGVELPEGECYSIALHLVNGEAIGADDTSSIHLVITSAKIIEHAAEIIEERFAISLNRSSYEFNRFAAHFRYLVARLMAGTEVKTENSSLFNQAALDFPDIYESVRAIDDYLQQEWGWACSNEEKLYLMMHCNRLVRSQ